MNMRPQHITITSIKYLISYPINMKVSNQVFTTSNSNKCVGGLCLQCQFMQIGQGKRAFFPTHIYRTNTNKHNYPCKKGSGRLTLTYSKQWLTLPDPFVHGQMCMLSVGVQCNVGMSMLRGTGVYGVHEYVRRERVHEIVLGVIHSQQFRQVR